MDSLFYLTGIYDLITALNDVNAAIKDALAGWPMWPRLEDGLPDELTRE